MYEETAQILNDPTHPVRHYLTADAATGAEDFYSLKTKFKPL